MCYLKILTLFIFIFFTDDTDFDGVVNQVLSFETTDTEKCFNITVINDEICEWDCEREEHFILILESEAYRVEVVDKVVDIIIQDEYEDECSENIINTIIVKITMALLYYSILAVYNYYWTGV